MRHRIRHTLSRTRPHVRRVGVSILTRSRRFIYRNRIALSVLFVLLLFAHLTNPFVWGNIVHDPFASHVDSDGNVVLSTQGDILLRGNRTFKNLALLKSGAHIITNVYTGSPKTKSETIEAIIDEIHEHRFNARFPYIISGDHFSVFYPRSLGVFYASLLDPRTARSTQDWLSRQQIYLQSTAYALASFASAPNLTTTIVPIGNKAVTAINFYAYPADTLYSILYAVQTMQDREILLKLYPTQIQSKTTLQTQHAATTLLQDYRDSLSKHLEKYIETVYDPKAGLVRQDITLSGTKDITRQYSGFYSNVVFWKTISLAQDLGIMSKDTQYLADLRSRILSTFWDESQGIFLEDLSPEAKENHYYSSDWLIALQTGFLSTKVPDDRVKMERLVEYIRKEKIDRPFGLKYSAKERTSRMYLGPRLAAPSYGGTAIWSHWGMEYIKLLTLLYKETGNEEYLSESYYQLERYAQNIEKYRGFPEVYSQNGEMFSTLFYKSVRQTGWVVNFEEARLLVEDAIATSKK